MLTGSSDMLLTQLSELVAEQMGWHFPKERWHDLERGIRSAAKELGFNDPESYLQRLLSSSLSKSQIEILASHLTVGETYFFREKQSFEALTERILPELISSRRGKEQHLRIWSAGCCTGEEPYSIAILISKILSDLKDWNITILATDINPRFLRKASDGVYSEWSFRATPAEVKEKYFSNRENRYEILPYIKNMVTFSYLNLAEDVYPSLINGTNGMDIIFCRNVLMYFTPERATKVVQKLYRSLVDGGWLIVSPTETSPIHYSQFVTVNLPDVILYKKDSKHLPKAEAKVSAQPPFDFAVQPLPEISSPIEEEKPSPLAAEAIRTPEPKPTPYEEALALYRQGRYAAASEKLLGLHSQSQANSEVYALLARACADQGKLAEALGWCDKAIAADRLNPGLYYLKAMILREQDALDEAAASLRRALYLDHNFVLAHFALANLARRQGKTKESDKHFNNAFSLIETYKPGEILPESEGITAARLMEIIRSVTCGGRLV